MDRLTEQELATRLRVSRRCLQNWRKKKRGPAWLEQPGIFYLIKDVEAWEKSVRVEGAKNVTSKK